jgi:hypothetical protein
MKKPVIPPPLAPRSVAMSLKVRRATSEALAKAARDNSRTRSAMGEVIIEIWLKEHSYLK